LTLFCPVNFLRLQLQNNLALGQRLVIFLTRAILLHVPAHMIRDEPQNFYSVSFFVRLHRGTRWTAISL